MASIQLRQLIDNILEDTSRDMREQCDTVDLNFQKRIEEMEDAKTKMEENLQKVHKRSVLMINENYKFTMSNKFTWLVLWSIILNNPPLSQLYYI